MRNRSRLDTREVPGGTLAYISCFIAVFAPITEATRHAIAFSTTTGWSFRKETRLRLVYQTNRGATLTFGLGCFTCSIAKVFSLGNRMHPS